MAKRSDEAFCVVWPKIEVFPNAVNGKWTAPQQAMKVLEEAIEVLEPCLDARPEDMDWEQVDHILEECADLMTATSNLVAIVYMGWLRANYPGGWENKLDLINHLSMVGKCEQVHGKNEHRGYYD